MIAQLAAIFTPAEWALLAVACAFVLGALLGRVVR